MTMDARSLPLARFTVLDLTRVRAGPTCVRQLVDWGANVLKVELPESVEGNAALGGPRHGSDFQNLHRNKRSITLNLKEPERLKAGVPCGPIYTIDQVFNDPQVQHLGMAQTVQHPVLGPIQLVGQPCTLSRHSNALRLAPPERGQDTAAVLAELGL